MSITDGIRRSPFNGRSAVSATWRPPGRAQPRAGAFLDRSALSGAAFQDSMPKLASTVTRTRAWLAALGDAGRHRSALMRSVPPLSTLLEVAARFGYGARGFVYVSIGIITFMAALDIVGDAVGSSGAIQALAGQPFGRMWLILLGLGLWAFVLWRILQSLFDADREGTAPKALMMRAGQAVSGLFYGVLASGVFELLDELPARPAAEDVAENQQKATTLPALPFGDWMLLAVGVVILGVGAGNVIKGLRADFGQALSCSAALCRRLTPFARTGYIARGLAYLPLGGFVVLAGLQASAAEVTSFGQALDSLEARPGGSWVLGITALGVIAFGAFAFVEARFRRIRPPRDLDTP
jgi:hypothetical protein